MKIKYKNYRWIIIGAIVGGLWGGLSIAIAYMIKETAKMEAIGIIILPFYISWLVLHAYFDILRIFPLLGGVILLIHFLVLPPIIGAILGAILGWLFDRIIKTRR